MPSHSLTHRRPRAGVSRPLPLLPPDAPPTSVRGVRSWREILTRVRYQVNNLNLSLLAAGTAFWAVLSIFPALIAMVTIYGLAASPDQVTKQVSRLGGSLSGSTKTVLTDWLKGLTSTGRQGLGIGLVVGLVALLWAVSSGVQNLVKAISAAYEQEDDRKFFKLRALSLVLSVGVIMLALIVLAAIGAGPAISHLVHIGWLRVLLNIAEWFVLAVILTAAIAVLYRFAPAQTPADWRWASAGAVFSTVFVVAASVGFSLYVRFFAHYNKTYGALGGVVVLMLWLYYCIYVVLIGALINAEAERQVAGATSPEAYPEASPDNVRGPSRLS